MAKAQRLSDPSEEILVQFKTQAFSDNENELQNFSPVRRAIVKHKRIKAKGKYKNTHRNTIHLLSDMQTNVQNILAFKGSCPEWQK